MQPKTDIIRKDFDSLFSEFRTQVGATKFFDAIQKKFESRMRNCEFMDFVLQHYEVEYGLYLFEKRKRAGLRPPNMIVKPHLYAAASFVASFVQIFRSLQAGGRKRLLGMLFDGLKPGRSVNALAHEFRIAVYFSSRGWNINFPDIEGTGKFDLMITRGDDRVEVEAKYFDVDTGEKFHREDARRILLSTIKLNPETEKGSIAVAVIKLPDRLDRKQLSIKLMLEDLVQCIEDHTNRSNQAYKISTHILQNKLGESDNEANSRAMRKVAAALARQEQGYILSRYNAGNQSGLVYCIQSEGESQKKKYVADSIAECGKAQFSGSYPAVIWAHFGGAQEQDIRQMMSPVGGNQITGVEEICGRVFAAPSRAHLIGLVFSGDSSVTSESYQLTARQKQRVASENGPLINFASRVSSFNAVEIMSRSIVDMPLGRKPKGAANRVKVNR